MKKNVITVIMLASFGVLAMAQDGRVGINTTDPKTTMDIRGKTDTSGVSLSTEITGLQAPRLTRAELTAKGNTLYGTDQKGALVYITDVSGGDSLIQRINVTAIGYYYFDGAIWQTVGGALAYTEPFQVQNTSKKSTLNKENIYQEGKVGVGFVAADGVSAKQFEVKGDIKAKSLYDGNYYGIETGLTEIGAPLTLMYSSNNADLNNASQTSISYLMPGVANFQSTYGQSNGSLGAYSYSTGANIGMTAISTDGNTTSSVWGYNDTMSKVYLQHSKSSAENSDITIEKLKGITFSFNNNTNALTGIYTFPRTNGAANQVLVTDGVPSGSQLSWENIASVPQNIRTINSGTIQIDDYTLLITGNITIPTATITDTGKIYNLVNDTNGSVTIAGTFRINGTNFINYTLNTTDFGKGIVVQSTGTAWAIISRY